MAFISYHADFQFRLSLRGLNFGQILVKTYLLQKWNRENTKIIFQFKEITLSVKKIVGLILVGRKFSQLPIMTIENKGFEIFSRSKF